jgi:photosystem II stability/assembly factor-like uncharacterized protein
MKRYLFIALLLCGAYSAQAQIVTDWTDQSYLGTNTANNLYKTHFVNADTGIAVGDSGIVLRTMDGGDNWQLRVTPKTYANVVFADIAAINALTMFVCGTDSNGNGILLKSVDMGGTWNIVPGAEKIDTGYTKIVFPTPTDGFIACGWGLVRKTTNGGANWTDVPPPTTRMITGIHFKDANVGFAINTDRNLWKTTNAGGVWNPVSTGGNDTSIVSAIGFINADTGYITHLDTILRTGDGGSSWTPVFNSPGGHAITDFEIAPNGRGIAIGDAANTWTTNDYGNNWSADPLSSHLGALTYSLFDVQMFWQPGWEYYTRIVGKFGTIAKGCYPPNVGFNAPTDAPYNTVVNFTNTSNGTTGFVWDFGDGSPTDKSLHPSHTYAQPGFYQVTLTARNFSKCNSVLTKTIVITASMAGNVYKRDQVTPVSDGKVFLFRKFPSQAKMVLADSTTLNASGYFEFLNKPKAEYLFLAKPDTSMAGLENTLVTFMDSTVFWEKGRFNNNIADNMALKIFLKQRPPSLPPGPGRIKGRVIERDTTNKKGPGDPLEGIDVSLVQSGSGNVVLSTSTSSGGSSTGGFYEFNNLPVGGYQLYVAIPGLGMDTLHELNLDSTNANMDNVIVEVDSNEIHVEIDSTTSTPVEKDVSKHFNLYPNPVDDILHVVFESEKEVKAHFEVYSMIGELVFVQEEVSLKKGRQNLIIDLRSVPAGTYLFMIKSEEPSLLDGATSKFMIFRK